MVRRLTECGDSWRRDSLELHANSQGVPMLYRASRWSFLLPLVLLIAIAACRDDVNTYARIGNHDTSVFDRDVGGTSDAATDGDHGLDTAHPDVPTPDDTADPPPDATTDAPPPLPDADLCPDAGGNNDSPCTRPDASNDTTPDPTEPCPDGEERVLGECVPILLDPPVECLEGEEEVNGACVPIQEPTPEPQTRVYEGSWTIRNRSDVDFITPYTSITGDLTIVGRGLSGVYLPNLQIVRLHLLIESTDPSAIPVRLPRLQEVGGRLNVRGNFTVLDLPQLERVEQNISIQPGQSFVQIVFPSLLSISGGIGISGGDNVALISMPVLFDVGWISFAEQQTLRSISMPSLAEVDETLQIIRNPRLPQCQVNALIDQVHAHGSYPEIPEITYTTNNPWATCE